MFVPGPEFVHYRITGIHMGDPNYLLEAEVLAAGDIARELYPLGSSLRVPLNLGALLDLTKPLERVVHYLLIPGRMVQP